MVHQRHQQSRVSLTGMVYSADEFVRDSSGQGLLQEPFDVIAGQAPQCDAHGSVEQASQFDWQIGPSAGTYRHDELGNVGGATVHHASKFVYRLSVSPLKIVNRQYRIAATNIPMSSARTLVHSAGE